jgi:hypothetical protein
MRSQLRTTSQPKTSHASTDDRLRAEYDRFCAGLKKERPIAVEYFGVPTFEEFKLTLMEDSDA